MCNNVLMLATDAVFTTAPLHIAAPVEIEGAEGIRPATVTPGNELGGWDFEEHTSIHIIMPGLYFKGDGNTPKTRGVPRQTVVEKKDEFMRIGAALVSGDIEMEEAQVTVPLTQFQGLRVSNHRGRLDLAGEWLPCGPNGEGKTLRYRWTNKRSSYAGRTTVNGAPALLTIPIQWNPYDSETLPYSKDIGKLFDDADWRLEKRDQPDWAEVLIESLQEEND
jgi:hypothetical protein